MKPDKRFYILVQYKNTTNNDYMKDFDAYVKVIESYGVKTTIHSGRVKTNLNKMVVHNPNNRL